MCWRMRRIECSGGASSLLIPSSSFFFLSFSFILIIAQVPCTTILLHPNLVVYRADLTGEETSSQDVNLPFSFPKSNCRH